MDRVPEPAPGPQPAFTAEDHAHMAHALALAVRGRYSTDPNPRVGCVLVRDGRVVGEGFHYVAGGPHAEVVALREAGAAAAGATAYVSLEPCCHHGRTPPCTDALVAARVGRVVFGARDSNPQVAGAGAAQLAAAGIEVAGGLMAAESRALNRGFFSRIERGRPFVVLKMALTLDGKVALANGESRWITGPEARADVQRLRAAASAVMTGAGTVLADDPSLNVRDPDLDLGGRQPLRVVLDSALRTPVGARMFALPGETLVLTTAPDAARSEALRRAGASVERVAARAGRVDPAAALAHLAVRGVNEVLVEAGPTLAGELARARLVDEYVLYVAPRLLGADARSAFAFPAPPALAAALELEILEERTIGRDRRIVARALDAPQGGARTAPERP